MIDIRYYKGELKVKILNKAYRKAIIEYLEPGLVGNQKIGYKRVNKGHRDIVPIRMCWRNRK